MSSDHYCDESSRTMRRELGCLDGSDEYGAGTLNFLQVDSPICSFPKETTFQDQLKSILTERISKEAEETGVKFVLKIF